jgi:hypothetical protein
MREDWDPGAPPHGGTWPWSPAGREGLGGPGLCWSMPYAFAAPRHVALGGGESFLRVHWVAVPRLRQCVHGVSIGGGGGAQRDGVMHSYPISHAATVRDILYHHSLSSTQPIRPWEHAGAPNASDGTPVRGRFHRGFGPF